MGRMLTVGMLIAISSCAVVSGSNDVGDKSKTLSQSCTKELGENLKVVFAVKENGSFEDFAPYEKQLHKTKSPFPIPATQILGEDLITIITYSNSPATTLICYWRLGQRVCQ